MYIGSEISKRFRNAKDHVDTQVEFEPMGKKGTGFKVQETS